MLTILFYSAFFFLIIDLYFLIPTVIAQIFNPSVEPAIPIGIPANETEQSKVRQ